MVLVFCRGGEVAGRERGEGVLDQKRERERSTSQHENRLVPRLLKPHSHHDLCSLYSLPTGLVGPTALWGWIMFLPDREFYNGGNIHSRHGINRSTVQKDDYEPKVIEYRWQTTMSTPTCAAEQPLERRDETTSRV